MILCKGIGTMRARGWAVIAAAILAIFHDSRAQSAADACTAPVRRANLDFTLRDVAGREIALRRFRGKVVLINFWATWCSPCREEIPGLVGLYEKYRQRGLVILGVSVDDPVSRLVPFVARLGMTYPVLIGTDRPDFLDAYGELAGFPTSVLLSRDGRVCARYAGLADGTRLERQILSLL